MQLGFLPRLTIRHTSQREVGQVYAPAVNAALFVAVVAIVDRLRLLRRARLRLRRRGDRHVHPQHDPVPRGRAAAVAQAASAGSRSVAARVPHDRGDVLRGQPDEGRARRLAAAGDRRGRLHAADDLAPGARDRDRQPHPRGGARCTSSSRASIGDEFRVERVPGTAVFLNANPQTTPLALRANVEHNHVLHERVIIVSLRDRAGAARVRRRALQCTTTSAIAADGITGLTARYGFQDHAARARDARSWRSTSPARAHARSRRRVLLPLADHDRADRRARG